MSRKVREIKKSFKVFCEGNTEYHYVDEMRQQLRLSISMKLVNMKGGGYSNFLESLKIDANTNCIAKFIIIDGDRAIDEKGEKNRLKELLDYCILQNKSGRTPHILIVNDPDFEYLACLHTSKYRGQNVEQYIIKEMGYRDLDSFKSDEKIYHVLNSNGNFSKIMLASLRHDRCFVRNCWTINKHKFEIKVDTIYKWEKLGQRGSNINEYFDILNAF